MHCEATEARAQNRRYCKHLLPSDDSSGFYCGVRLSATAVYNHGWPETSVRSCCSRGEAGKPLCGVYRTSDGNSSSAHSARAHFTDNVWRARVHDRSTGQTGRDTWRPFHFSSVCAKRAGLSWTAARSLCEQTSSTLALISAKDDADHRIRSSVSWRSTRTERAVDIAGAGVL